MLMYRYTALDETGVASSGLVEATDEHQAAEILRTRKLLITSLEVKQDKSILDQLSFGNKVPEKMLATATRQLATMITAGLPLTQALELLQAQIKHKLFAKTLGDIVRDIDGGLSLSKSLEKYPQVFPRLYISLIKAGEASGNLDTILVKLADSLEEQVEFKSKIKGALIYPAMILLAMVGVIGIMIVFVIPQMKEVYVGLGAELPLMTQALIGLSDFVVEKWYIVILLTVAGLYAYRWFSKTLRGRYILADLYAKMPIFGKLSTQVQLTSYIETMSLLVSSGVPILDALDIAKETLSNIRFQEASAAVSRSIEKGMTMAEAVKRQPVFPVILPQMISIGEETGKLDEVLAKVGRSFSEESSNTVKNLSTALEPLIMIFLGVGVGFLILALIMPIYGTLNSIG